MGPTPSTIEMESEWGSTDAIEPPPTEIKAIAKGHDEEFYYLAGPMTGYEQFNFPAFDNAAKVLRAEGFNIVSPSELDDPEVRDWALGSPDGLHKDADTAYGDFLARDVIIVANENCIGVICLDGWEKSRGAQLETHVARVLGKKILRYPGLERIQFESEPEPPVKRNVLQEAEILVGGDRGEEYGHPLDDFKRSAAIISAILSKQLQEGKAVRPDQIPLLMIAVKLSRLVESPRKKDSLIDIPGYARTAEMVWEREDELAEIAEARKKIDEYVS